MIEVGLFSKADARPLTDQLESYAQRVVNDRHSFNVLEVFLTQMEDLFGTLAGLLDRESNALGRDEVSISWSIMRQEHDRIAQRLDSELDEFVRFLKTILRTAKEDERFLTRNRDSIANLFSEGELRVAFIESAQKSVEDEERFVTSLEFLDDLNDRSSKLVKDLVKLSNLFGSEKADRDKTLALIESCRMRAVKIHEQCKQVGKQVPGLRDLDAQQARKLGMLARSMRSALV